MEEEKKKNLEQSVREALFSDDNELGFVVRKWPNGRNSEIGVMSKNLYEISEEFNIGFKHSISVYEGSYDISSAVTEFIPYGECPKKYQKEIEARQIAIDAFRYKEKKSKFNKEGFITLPICKQSATVMYILGGHDNDDITPILSGEKSEQQFVEVEDSLKIPMTQRELAEIGLLPEDFNWQETRRSKITGADISEADKEQGLRPTEVSGIKDLIRNLIEKIANFFKSKEEK